MPRGRDDHNGGSGGTLRPQDRDTDDTPAPIAGSEAVNAAHATAIEETKSKSMLDVTRRDYRNRIKRLIVWLKK